MNRNLVKWKSVKCRSWRGHDVLIGLPEVVDIRYRGTLLSCILAMPQKTPITFEDAIQLLSDKLGEMFDAGQFGDKSGQYGWYDRNFVKWISTLGYHIEISGDEFESYAMTDKVA